MSPPPVRVAINGFGRIGRQVLRQVSRDEQLCVVAVNTRRTTPAVLAQLFRYDSVFGRYHGEVHAGTGMLVVDGREVLVSTEADPENCRWGDLGVDVVVEATGCFRLRDEAAAHLRCGARKVIVTAPCRDADITIVMGVNHQRYDDDAHDVVSAASCTTNCLAPMARVLHQSFGLESGMVTTVHAYTRDQEIHDAAHDDPRRGRAACLNMTPTATGAASAIDTVMPELAGRLHGIAIRVPVPDVSLVDLTATLGTDATNREVNDAFLRASAEAGWAGLLAATDEPLVSSDFVGDRHSCTVDMASTRRGRGNQVKVLGWYD
ncbi:MAG: type I glyceraldehyde-3-phosphate dehydrogenase, partial [Geodermatophilaceae bacterium]|nr:type I glyceraldehyde-3-phosphate dehydrogenase [Geodermatophilaceae bacterium]